MKITPSFTLAVRHRRLEWVRRGALWAAWLVAINGALALLASAIPAVIPALLAGLAPMAPVLALAHVLNGVALGAFIARRPRAQVVSAVAGVAVSLAAFGVVAFAGGSTAQPSVAGSLLALVASVALTLACIRGRPALVQITLGLAGFTLLSMVITVVGVRLVGAFAAESANTFLGASAQDMIGATLMSVSFLGLVWAEGVSTSEPPRWLAAAAGLASLTAVLLLWRALDERETEQLQSQTRLAAQVRRDAVVREMQLTARSLRRATDRSMNGTTISQQRNDLAALVRDLPGLSGAMRVKEDGGVAFWVPVQLDTATLKAAWDRAAFRDRDTVLYAPLDERAEHLVLTLPACRRSGCDGAIVATVDARALLAAVMPIIRGRFVYMVSHGGTVLGTDSLRVPDSPWREDLDVRFGPVVWLLSALPSDATLQQMRTTLPSAVLFMGLIVSALLPVTLRLGEVAWRSARESERVRLSAALERATDAIWEWNLVTGEAFRSPSLWRHLGYDPAAAAPGNAGWTALIHPDDREHVEAALARHIAGETTNFEAEYRVRDWSGNWHVIVDRGRVVERLPDGTATRLLGIRADVTEARHSEEARETSEQRFRAIFDSGFQFQLLLDAEGRVLEVNRAMLDRVGVPASEIVGRPVWETLWWPRNAESATRLREQLASVSSVSSGASVQYEAEIAGQAGESLILEIGIKPVSDARGRAEQLLLEARDVTERRRIDAALRELDTLVAMGRMAARVAHEINNPLAGIQYSFLLIKDAIPEDHPHYWYAGAIEREIARISTVTRQLYETYRPEKELSARVSLSAVVGDAIAFLRQVNRATEVRIESDLSGAPQTVPVPSAVLRQVVYNLVQNAMDASPPGTVVRITAVATDVMLELSVSDEGPGIPPAMRERVFEPFFSTKDARHRTSGMGLGLALVRSTVNSAGGRIRAEQAPAGGALFIVTLPFTNKETIEVA